MPGLQPGRIAQVAKDIVADRQTGMSRGVQDNERIAAGVAAGRIEVLKRAVPDREVARAIVHVQGAVAGGRLAAIHEQQLKVVQDRAAGVADDVQQLPVGRHARVAQNRLAAPVGAHGHRHRNGQRVGRMGKDIAAFEIDRVLRPRDPKHRREILRGRARPEPVARAVRRNIPVARPDGADDGYRIGARGAGAVRARRDNDIRAGCQGHAERPARRRGGHAARSARGRVPEDQACRPGVVRAGDINAAAVSWHQQRAADIRDVNPWRADRARDRQRVNTRLAELIRAGDRDQIVAHGQTRAERPARRRCRHRARSAKRVVPRDPADGRAAVRPGNRVTCDSVRHAYV